MNTDELYNTTKARLSSYGVFKRGVVERIAKLAAVQSRFKTYQDFFNEVGVGEPFLHIAADGSGVPVIDVASRPGEYEGVLVVHAPMEMPLNQAQLYLIATLAKANPGYRIIGFGNPSGDRFFYKEQNLKFWRKAKILLTGNKQGLLEAELDYLRSQGVTKTHQAGFSYGALKAVLESQYLPQGSVQSIILIDPVAKPRPLLKLARDFSKTYGPLGKYVNQVNLQTYHTARGDAAKGRNHRKALLRPVNIIIATLLARLDISKRLKQALVQQPTASVTVAWGTASELGDDKLIVSNIEKLKLSGIDARGLRFTGLEHAMANDVFLYAAIVRQSIYDNY